MSTTDLQIHSGIVKIEEKSRRMCGRIKTKGREILSDFEITPPQFDALLTLIEDGELTIGELSSRMYLACSTVTDLLDRMERNALVIRIKDEKDRRIVRVQVLDKGHTIVEQVLEARRRYLAAVLEPCDKEDVERIEACFDQLIKLMG